MTKNFLSKCVIIVALLLAAGGAAGAATFTVETTANTGPGSLRQAITDANTLSGEDMIIFHIPTSEATTQGDATWWKITPTSALPAITEDVYIDGQSQTTWGGDLNPYGYEVEIDGSSAGAAHGLELSNTCLQGTLWHLTINRFSSGAGVYINGGDMNGVYNCYIGVDATGEVAAANDIGVVITNEAANNWIGAELVGCVISGNTNYGVLIDGVNCTGNGVAGSKVGTDKDGLTAVPNGADGVYIHNGAKYNKVGTGTVNGRNIISGNSGSGVGINGTGTDQNDILGNYIGLNVNGTAALANGLNGVWILWSAKNLIGNGTDGGRNVISGNGAYGVRINQNGASSNEVYGNYIGTNASATDRIPNTSNGILLGEGVVQFNKIGLQTAGYRNVISGNNSSGIYITGTDVNSNEVVGNYIGTNAGGDNLRNTNYGVYLYSGPQFNVIGPGNTIAWNGQDGVGVDGASTNYNTISQNSIYSNDYLGIRLMNGGNNNASPPNIITADYNGLTTLTLVTGEATPNAAVEVFATGIPDAGGSGEGESFLSLTGADGSGHWSVSIPFLSGGTTLSAVAIELDHDTSMFALNKVSTVTAFSDYYVSPSGDNSNDGSSWGTAWKNISYACTQAASGNTVHVAAGLYTTAEGESFPVNVGNGVYLKSEATPTTAATLDAESNTIPSSQGVINLGPYATLEGFTVKSDYTDNFGITAYRYTDILNNRLIFEQDVGIRVVQNEGTVEVRGNTINLLSGGDGVFIISSSLPLYYTVEGNVIDVAGSAGVGVYIGSTRNVDILANTIEVESYNFGIYLAYCDNLNIIRNVIRGAGLSSSIGIYCSEDLGNCNIVSNEVVNFSEGLRIDVADYRLVSVIKNSILKNTDYGIRAFGTNNYGTLTVRNSIIAADPTREAGSGGTVGIQRSGTKVYVYYSDIYGNETNYDNVTPSTGTISAVAQFVDPDNDDFHLKYNSPCIDSGDPAAQYNDPDGSRSDMGCYPFDLTVAGTLAVCVKTPNGGETLVADQLYPIIWYATPEIGQSITNIELHYSDDDGSSWTPIDLAEPNDGSYDWTVPSDIDTTKALVKVGAFGSSATDESDGNFTLSSGGYYVSPSGDNSNDGTSWATAWRNITYAATQAASAETVHVAAGLYDSSAGESFPIAVPGTVELVAVSTAATIDAGSEIRVMTLGPDTTLEGFTIQNSGAATDNGALYLQGNNTRILNNSINSSGSGARSIYLVDAADNCLISGNRINATVGSGVGIYPYYNNDYLTISSNTIEAGDSGIYFVGGWYSGGAADDFKVFGNTITGAGAGYGVHAGHSWGINYADTPVANGYITTNEVRGFDTGIRVYTYGVVTIESNDVLASASYGIYYYNGTSDISKNIITATVSLGSFVVGTYGIHRNAGTLNLSNNDIWNNHYNYSGVSPGTGDIERYPRFVSWEVNDYRLFNDSPCNLGGGNYIGCYAPIGASSDILGASWVVPGPDDGSGNGTFASPWKTLRKGLSKTEYIVNAKAGTYTAGESFPLTMSYCQSIKSGASPSYLASIEGTGVRLVTVGQYSTVEGFSIQTSGTATDNGALYLQVDNAQILNNIINCSGSGARAIYLADGGNNCLISGNRISATTGSGIGIYPNYNNDYLTISSNTIEAGDSGIYFVGGWYSGGAADDFKVFGNTIIGAGAGYGVHAGHSAGINYADTPVANGYIITNEVRGFDTSIRVYTYGVVTIESNDVLGSASYGIYYYNGTSDISKNIITATVSLGSFVLDTYGIHRNAGTLNLSNNDIWNNHYNYSGVSPGTGDIERYPRFVSWEVNDYRLFNDSPCNLGGGNYMGCYAPIGATSDITGESWVVPGPDDGSGNGTFASPWKTLSKGLSKTEYTVNAKAGTYTAGESFPVTMSRYQTIRSGASPSYLATIEGTSARMVSLAPITTMEGFTIKTSGQGDYNGALYALAENVQILNNTITCSATSARGIFLPNLADGSFIKGNDVWVASSGVGMYLDTSANNEIIEENTIEVESGGYGIYFRSANANYSVRKNVVKGGGSGYGISSQPSSSLKVNGGSISSNEVRGFGEGVQLNAENVTVDIYHNTLVENTIGIRGREYYSSPVYEVKNNIICAAARLGSFTSGTEGIRRDGGTVNSTYNDIWNVSTHYAGTVSDQTGDIHSYPRFISPEADNYRIGFDSPCAAAGEGGTYMGRYAPSGTSEVTSESWVDDDGNDVSGDGSFGNPWKTINKGLSKTDRIIHVKAGLYDTGNGESFPLTLAEYQYLRSEASPTVLATIETAAARAVGMGPDTTLEGFTVMAAGQGDYDGAVYLLDTGNVLSNTITCSATSARGVYLPNASDYSLIKGNDILVANGRGVYLDQSADNVTVEENTIEVGSGYGIYFRNLNTNYSVRKNVIKGGGSGYGISSQPSSSLKVNGGSISSNEVRGFGEGVQLNAENVTVNIHQNTLVENTIGIRGREYYSSPVYDIKNNIICNDPTQESGTGTGVQRDGGTVNVSYSDIYGVTNIYGGTINTTTGTIHAVAQFVNSGAKDFHLLPSSPCIDTGDPAWTDPDGTRSDMGAYPFFQSDFTGPTTEVTAPVTGETLSGGSPYNITWTATDETGIADNSLAIYYSTDSGTTFPNLITQGASSVSPYSWSVPLINSNQVRLRINLRDLAPANNPGTGESYGDFTIDTTIPIVTVEAPAGGEVWGGGSTHAISWEATDNLGFAPDPISIYFTSKEGTSWSTIATGEANDGIYPNWTVPTTNSAQCRIRIEALDNSGETGTGESTNFTIDSLAPAVNISAPNGGEYISAESIYMIQYTASDEVGLATNPIDIYYTTDEATWFSIAANQTNSGSYPWPVPNLAASTAKVSVEAIDQAGNIGRDISAGSFTIDNTSPEVTLYNPSGGENISGESTYTINYNVSDEVGLKTNPISIYYSMDGGATWILIEENLANTGSYDWDVPNVNTTNGRIRIIAEDRAGNQNIQDSPEFIITATLPPDDVPPTITIHVGQNENPLKNGDYITPLPNIRALITDDIQTNPCYARIFLNGEEKTVTLNMVSERTLEAYYQVESELEGENIKTHTIEAEGRDAAGNFASKEVSGLKVSYEKVKVEDIPLSFPKNALPGARGTEKEIIISYKLNIDADVTIVVIGMDQTVWTRRYQAGENGGNAGYNAIEFSGVSDLTGQRLGNGIYVYKILAYNRELGKGYVVIYE